MDLVSVIIPFYKKKIFIKETIFSVLKQTYKNLEIIIIYDDESHNDLNFIKEISALDSRISIIINLKNLGAGKSRNIGIELSNGSYIAFIDSDDIWKKDKIMKQISFMKKNTLLASHTSYEIIDHKKDGYISSANPEEISEYILDYFSVDSNELEMSKAISNKQDSYSWDSFVDEII